MRSIRVKRSFLKESGLRLDAPYHLSEGVITKRKFKTPKYPIETLVNLTKDIFRGNIFKRTYVDSADTGYPYLTGSDMMKLDINSGKYLSKKFTDVLKLMLDSNWILVTCSGTIGNTVYTNEDFKGVVGTHDLIRIIPDEEKMLSGFLYAFLTSKYGHGLLTQSGYGGVVKHIEPHHIVDLPVPIFPNEKQAEIHQLIVEASELRVEANRLLEETHKDIEKALALKEENKTKKASILDITKSHQKRFEANYYNSKGSHYKNQILKGQFKLLKELSEGIFRPGIFKRNYVEKGTDFLGGSDITKMIPDSDKRLARTSTSNYDDLVLKEDWILVTCGGTIGTCVYVNEYLSKKLASQHILRVIPKDIKAGYLFSYLSSAIGEKVIQSFTYGSVIPQIEPHHLGNTPVPLLGETKENEIHNKIMTYKNNLNKSILKEKEAISLIEKEIDLWQN